MVCDRHDLRPPRMLLHAVLPILTLAMDSMCGSSLPVHTRAASDKCSALGT